MRLPNLARLLRLNCHNEFFNGIAGRKGFLVSPYKSESLRTLKQKKVSDQIIQLY